MLEARICPVCLNQSTECSQYMHRTAGWHHSKSPSCCGESTWLPRPLSVLLVSAWHNSNNSISMKLPIKASFVEIAIAIIVLKHSVFIWGDSPWFELRLYRLCSWGMDWIDFQQVQEVFLFSLSVKWLWCWYQVLIGEQLSHVTDDSLSSNVEVKNEWSSFSTFLYVSSVCSDTCSLTSCNQLVFFRKICVIKEYV